MYSKYTQKYYWALRSSHNCIFLHLIELSHFNCDHLDFLFTLIHFLLIADFHHPLFSFIVI